VVIAAATAAAGALVFTSGPAQAGTAPKTTTNPTKAAAGWLARRLAGGTHVVTSYGGTSFADYGGTADVVYALSAARSGKDTIAAASAWLAKNADTYADLGNATGAGPYDGSVAKLALVAEVTGADPTDFGGHNLLQALHDDQCTAVANADGSDFSAPACPGVGAARSIYSSVSESLAILAQARGGAGYAPDADAVSYFLSLQCPNGGFTGATSACTDNSDASVDETGYALMALQALHDQSAAASKAAAWLVSTRTHGYWVVQGGPDADSTGIAAAALAGVGKDIASSRAWLRGQQVTTGPTVGAGASRGALKYQGRFDAASSPKATADGLLGMVAHGSLATLTDRRAVEGTRVLRLRRPTPIKSAVTRGGKQKVVATGFAAKEKVRFALRSGSVGVATANAHGTVRLRFTVPRHTKPVRHVVRLTGLRSGLHATSLAFRVTR
jgi:hypothetical protein